MSYKMSMKGVSAAVAIAAATICAVSNAATMTVDQRVEAAYAPDFTPLPSVPDLGNYVGGPIVIQVDYHMVTENIGPGERGFGNVGYSIAMGPGVSDAAGGYQPNTESVDTNGALPGGIQPLYFANADAGSNTSDLQGIFATVASGLSSPHAADPRVKIGQPGGKSLLGSVFYLWDGTTTSAITVPTVLVSTLLTNGQFGPGVAGLTEPILLVPAIPEPASLALGGIAAIGLLFSRRRSA